MATSSTASQPSSVYAGGAAAKVPSFDVNYHLRQQHRATSSTINSNIAAAAVTLGGSSPSPLGFQVIHVGNGQVALKMQPQLVVSNSSMVPPQLSLANFVTGSLTGSGIPGISAVPMTSIRSSSLQQQLSEAASSAQQVSMESKVMTSLQQQHNMGAVSSASTMGCSPSSAKLGKHSPTDNHSRMISSNSVGEQGMDTSEQQQPPSSDSSPISTNGGGRETTAAGAASSASPPHDMLRRADDIKGYMLQDALIPQSMNTLSLFAPIPAPPNSCPSPQSSTGGGGHHTLSMNSEGPGDGAKKREMRLYKNREAARECRRKKKEYLRCLENRVQLLESQNKSLIEELRMLKEHYQAKEHQQYAVSSTSTRGDHLNNAQLEDSSSVTASPPPPPPPSHQQHSQLLVNPKELYSSSQDSPDEDSP